ncbi:MAG TPA: RNB domain-containing ribonuclease [Candidatus Binataceae bacterium]|nr:RNB domain-containing ribonuclease [Candidatus Binataceae bacterium]
MARYDAPMNQATALNRNQLRSIARRAMLERDLLPDFSAAVMAETDSIPSAATATADSSLRDLRHLLWASIDNDDSLDLDQLSVAEQLPGGTVKICVAVADVDAIVKKGSAIDHHARINTTSVYTAAEIFPMLPEKLSTDLTSLADGKERLAIVIEMEVDANGGLETSDIYRAVVVNRAKLAYNGVAAWLDGTAPAPAPISAVPGLDENLRLQDRVARSMKARRHQRGALTLETIEPRPVFDGDWLSDLQADRKNRATELIEDFMIAANGVTARYLDQKQFPALRRILRSPERWMRIVELAKDLGERLPPHPDCQALQEFLEKRRLAEPERFPDLSLSVVKLLGRGEYVLEFPGQPVAGHFGLAVRDYTHSTAPNRRFPDLITQRLLKSALSGTRRPYRDDELGELARHCTKQEDNAAKVERRVRKSAAALLLESRLSEHFNGIVTGASSKGTWVRIDHPAAESKVVRGYQGLDVGDHVGVELTRVDVERGFVDFARVKKS